MTIEEFKALTGRTAVFTPPTGRKNYGILKIIHLADFRDCNSPEFKTAYPWAWIGAEIEESSNEIKPEDLEDQLAYLAEDY